jgi:hypothetical protein
MDAVYTLENRDDTDFESTEIEESEYYIMNDYEDSVVSKYIYAEHSSVIQDTFEDVLGSLSDDEFDEMIDEGIIIVDE